MESSFDLFSLPLEIREEIYFHLITLIFGTCYTYNTDLGRHILDPKFVTWRLRSRVAETTIRDFAKILTVSQQMKTEVQSVLYQRFSLFFDDKVFRPRGDADYYQMFGKSNLGLVRNLVWKCRIYSTSYRASYSRNLELLEKMEWLAAYLPQLRRVDLQLDGDPADKRTVAKRVIGLANLLTHVPEVAIYLNKDVEGFREEIVRLNIDRGRESHAKIVSLFQKCMNFIFYARVF